MYQGGLGRSGQQRACGGTGLEMERGVGFSKLEWQKEGLLAYVSVCACVHVCMRVWMDGPQKPVLTGQIEDGFGEPQRVVLVARVKSHQILAPLPYRSSLETGSDMRT